MLSVTYGVNGHATSEGLFAEWQEKYEKTNQERDAIRNEVTVFYTNVANLSTSDMTQIVSHAANIFKKNGLTDKNISFKPLSQKEAKKKSVMGKNQAFVAFIDQKMYRYDKVKNLKQSLHPGNSVINNNGGVEVYNEDQLRYDTPWQSWVNLATTKTHPNPNYAAGYIMAHEILHQLLGFAAFDKYGDVKKALGRLHSGGDWGPNLNMDGKSVIIPKGPKNKIQSAEHIIPTQLSELKHFFGL